MTTSPTTATIAPTSDYFVGNTVPYYALDKMSMDTIFDRLESARVNRVMFIAHDPWGATFEQDPSFYPGALRPFRIPESVPHGDCLARVCEAAAKRGMKVYAHLLPYDAIDAGHWPAVGAHEPDLSARMQRGLSACAQIDIFGRKDSRVSWLHPEYRQYQLSVAEDLLRRYPIEGIKYNVESTGPLSTVMIGRDAAGYTHRKPRAPVCFGPHTLAEARKRGINIERARAGWMELLNFSETSWRHARAEGDTFAAPGVSLGDSTAASTPPDGYFTTFLRILMRYPEILQWNQMWYDGVFSLYAELHGLCKLVHPDRKLGLHIWHHRAFSIFDRAAWDYTELARRSDWIKPKIDHRTAGFRFHQDVRRWTQALFRDRPSTAAYEAWCTLLGWDHEVAYEQLPSTGMSLDYVRRDTACAVAAVPAGFPIYPGLSVGIPSPTLTSTCDSISEAIHAADAGGAAGIMIARNITEQKPDQLASAGAAIDAVLAKRKATAPTAP
jgi:hypothetical protein